MYLKDGREIYESDKYPGYFIDANTGAFCDKEGNYIGGNSDNGDKPGNGKVFQPPHEEYVFVSKTGRQFYPNSTKSATTVMTISEVRQKGYKPSKAYLLFKKRTKKNTIKIKR